MYSALTLFGLVFIAAVVDTFGGNRVIEPVKNFVAENYPRSYGGMFGWPLALTLAIYAIGLCASPFFGLEATLEDVSTMFVLGFFLGMVTCFLATLRDIGSHAKRIVTGKDGRYSQPFEKISSLCFIACVYGSIGALFFSRTSTWNIFH
jgi:hypothetical protein